jgi:hypothetical protein
LHPAGTSSIHYSGSLKEIKNNVTGNITATAFFLEIWPAALKTADYLLGTRIGKLLFKGEDGY